MGIGVQAIRAIDTEFRGDLYRSRLEARWAVFLFEVGLDYQYEPQGYEIDTDEGRVRYLPDFWLPTKRYWIEVKPESPDSSELLKASALVNATGFPLFFLIGTPTPFKWTVIRNTDGSPSDFICEGSHLHVFPNEQWDGRLGWGECVCHRPGVVDLGLDGCDFEVEARAGTQTCRGIRPDSPRLLRAYRAARQARFEFLPKNMRRIVEDANG